MEKVNKEEINFEDIFSGKNSDGIMLRSVPRKTNYSYLDSIYLFVIEFFLTLRNFDYQLVFSIEAYSKDKQFRRRNEIGAVDDGYINLFQLGKDKSFSIEAINDITTIADDSTIGNFFYARLKSLNGLHKYFVNRVILGENIDLGIVKNKILRLFNEPKDGVGVLVFCTDDGLGIFILNKSSQEIRDPFHLSFGNEGHIALRTKDEKIKKIFIDAFLKYFEGYFEY